MAKHLPDHEAGRRLTIGASDADDTEVLGWAMIFRDGDLRLQEMIGKNRLIVKWKLSK